MSVIHSKGKIRRPAEFEPHVRTWMGWPHRSDLYGARLANVQSEFIAIVSAIAQFEPVVVLAPAEHAGDAQRRLDGTAKVVPLAIDDFWLRDTGPTFVANGHGALAGVSWKFNAWGGKHAPWDQDDAIAGEILKLEHAPMRQSWLTCEGGSLACDGEGTLIVTETSILNPNRNPGVGKALAEAELKAMLGVEKIIWLPGDPMDKETDGHIDGMCAFVKPGVVLFEENPDPCHPHARILLENLACLRRETDAKGHSFEVLPLIEAADAVMTSDVFCRSYINFYIANGGVVMPGYGCASDAMAAETVARAFPDRKIVQIEVNAIAAGGGVIHCITQEQPALTGTD
jgi:agmatine deiminase